MLEVSKAKMFNFKISKQKYLDNTRYSKIECLVIYNILTLYSSFLDNWAYFFNDSSNHFSPNGPFLGPVRQGAGIIESNPRTEIFLPFFMYTWIFCSTDVLFRLSGQFADDSISVHLGNAFSMSGSNYLFLSTISCNSFPVGPGITSVLQMRM